MSGIIINFSLVLLFLDQLLLLLHESEDGIVNGAPFSYFNIVSSNPPMVSLAIQRPNDHLKDTARNIYSNRQFVVHIVDEENVAKINETAASLPATESEIELANLTLVQSESVSVPGVKEAKVRMECRLSSSRFL